MPRLWRPTLRVWIPPMDSPDRARLSGAASVRKFACTNGMMSFNISSLKGSLVASEVLTWPPDGVQPDGITTIIGLIVFAARRLSRMSFARPTVDHEDA